MHTAHVAGGIKKHAEHKESTNLMKFVISIVGHCKIDKPICCVSTIVVTVMANSYCTVAAEPEMIVQGIPVKLQFYDCMQIMLFIIKSQRLPVSLFAVLA